MKSGFKIAQGQATAQGFQGKLDLKSSLSELTTSPHWKGDINEAVDHPFWFPVLKDAVQKLASREDLLPPFPPSPEIFYDVVPVPSSSDPMLPPSTAIISSNTFPTVIPDSSSSLPPAVET